MPTPRPSTSIASLLVAVATYVSETAAQVTPSSSSTARYLVLSIENGVASVVQSKSVRLPSPLRSLSAGEVSKRLARRQRDGKGYRVTVRDVRSSIVYQGLVEAPQWLRGEFHGYGEIDGRALELGASLIAVRIPEAPGGVLTLASDTSSAPTSEVDLPLPQAKRQATLVVENAAQPLPGWSNGDSANRVDLLILGDGYRSGEQSKFASDAALLADSFFSITPYREYRNYVNVWTLFVPSIQSGADHPPYSSRCGEYGMAQGCCADPGAAAQPSKFVDTAFDATFCSYNVQRLLTVNLEKVLSAAAAAPMWDKIMVMVNDTTYGGSGGAAAVVSTNDLSVQVAQHEYGHSFTHLADEYETPYPGYPACSDLFGSVPCEDNVTDQTNPQLVKWSRWMSPTQQSVSSAQPITDTDAGLWEGARFLSRGVYRQGYDCLMRVLGTPFGDVASEAYAVQLYRGGWGTPALGIDNIEPGSESPAPGNVTTSISTWFNATVLGPQVGSSLDVVWSVDGVPVASMTATTGSTVRYNLQRPRGDYTLTLEVGDTSSILHPTTRPSLVSSRSWRVSVSPCGNGVVDPGEACDDASTQAGDGCSAQCQLESCSLCSGAPSSCEPIVACASGDGCCPAGCADMADADCPVLVAGSRLVIKDQSDARRRKLDLLVRDPRIRAGFSEAVNPMLDGASVQLFNENTGTSVCLTLPSQNWSATGTAFTYRDKDYSKGPCKGAVIADGQGFKVSCNGKTKALDYALDAPTQGRVGVIFRIGSARYCTVFGGQVRSDIGLDPARGSRRGQFKARNAATPPSCPVPRDRCS